MRIEDIKVDQVVYVKTKYINPVQCNVERIYPNDCTVLVCMNIPSRVKYSRIPVDLLNTNYEEV